MSISAGQDAVAGDFVEESAGVSDAGKVPKLHTTDGRLHPKNIKNGFGGTGADGALNITTDTNLDAAGVMYLVKNYTTGNIDVTKTLTLINAHATYGTLVHLKFTGNVTINGTLTLAGKGGKGGDAALSAGAGSDGSPGFGSLFSLGGTYELKTDGSPNAALQFVHCATYGMHGGPGSPATSLGEAGGGGGGGGNYVAGSKGAAGSVGTYFYLGYGGLGGRQEVGAVFGTPVGQIITIIPQAGSGGGSGGNANNSNDSGAGGNGGGGLIIEVLGNLTFGASSVINLSGANGGNATGATDDGAGGGGGGAGGTGLILYRGTLTNSGLTKTVTGGTGGSATSSSGAGGNGGAGRIEIIQNTMIV